MFLHNRGESTFFLDSTVTAIMQLAIGLVIDLGLHRPPGLPKRGSSALVSDAAVILKAGISGREHTLQDRRAGLGCFYIISL